MYNSYIMMENVMQSWEEMTVLEQMQCQFWDMYKDAYGVRPRGIDTTSWTEADFEAEFQMLGKVIEQEDIARKEAEAEATAKFEQHVTNTICMGAKDRATALRWIMDASQADGDWEYFCFLNGLPYGYFREMEVA
jgi:hypothetical protein